jgi:hypothetical protein
MEIRIEIDAGGADGFTQHQINRDDAFTAVFAAVTLLLAPYQGQMAARTKQIRRVLHLAGAVGEPTEDDRIGLIRRLSDSLHQLVQWWHDAQHGVAFRHCDDEMCVTVRGQLHEAETAARTASGVG